MQGTQYPNFHRFFHSSWRLVFAKENRSNTALPFLTIQSNFLIPLLSKIKSTYETKFLFHEQNSRWKILDGTNLSNVNIIFRLDNPLIILWKKFFVPGDRGKVKKKIIEDHQRKDKTVYDFENRSKWAVYFQPTGNQETVRRIFERLSGLDCSPIEFHANVTVLNSPLPFNAILNRRSNEPTQSFLPNKFTQSRTRDSIRVERRWHAVTIDRTVEISTRSAAGKQRSSCGFYLWVRIPG